jgi:epoxyqueuosine reductase QueG
VITDLPMATDQPIKFGVKEFCDVCKKCAEMCPSQAISYGGQTREAPTISTNPGVMKWPMDNEKCMVGWQMSGGDCGNCIRTCPFNKPQGWLHDMTAIMVGVKSGLIDSVMVRLDDASGYGGEEVVGMFFVLPIMAVQTWISRFFGSKPGERI